MTMVFVEQLGAGPGSAHKVNELSYKKDYEYSLHSNVVNLSFQQPGLLFCLLSQGAGAVLDE